jgi:hypothetical protein
MRGAAAALSKPDANAKARACTAFVEDPRRGQDWRGGLGKTPGHSTGRSPGQGNGV